MSIEARSVCVASLPRSLLIFRRIRIPSIHPHIVSTMVEPAAISASTWNLSRGTGLAPRTSAPERTGTSPALLGPESRSGRFLLSEFGLKRMTLPFRSGFPLSISPHGPDRSPDTPNRKFVGTRDRLSGNDVNQALQCILTECLRPSALKCYVARMSRNWLQTSTGLNVVAVGLVAIVYSLLLFTIQDCWILLRGEPYVLHGLRGIWYLLWAAIAAMFSAATVFIWRSGLQRIVVALFSISMASHIVEQFVSFPGQQLRLAATCRIIVAGALILLFLRYRSATMTSNS